MAWSPPPAGRTGVGSSPTLQSPYARSRSGASNPASANPGMPLAGLWPLGCVAKRIGQPFHEDPWDFYHVGLCRRPVKSLFLGPQLLSHQRQSVGEGRTALVVPGRWANGVHVLIISHLVVSQEGDHGEQAQQRRGGPSDRLLRPLPLGFEAQALTHLLKSSLQLPSPDKVRDDPLGICIELGAKQSLSLELSIRIPDQYPAQRHSGQARAVPNRRCRDHLDGALLTTVPASDRDRFPLGFGILCYDGEVRKSIAFEARPS